MGNGDWLGRSVTLQPNKLPADGVVDAAAGGIQPRSLRNRVTSGVSGYVSRAFRWTWREIILVVFAAFIAGLGAGAAQALVSWALN